MAVAVAGRWWKAAACIAAVEVAVRVGLHSGMADVMSVVMGGWAWGG